VSWRKRNSPEGAAGSDHWLRAETPARSRPWAYEELLFGSSRERAKARELTALVRELESERGELAKLYRELDTHLAKIEGLERRLEELTPAVERNRSRSASSRAVPRPQTMPAEAVDFRSPVVQSAYSLTRCEGFRVDSATGRPVGFVEGIRFVSRIDEPDLLEVRGGRLGRELLLIPIEAVAEVSPDEGRIVIRTAPDPSADLLHEVGDRLRRAFHFHQPSS
jgi:hypothetical protein